MSMGSVLCYFLIISDVQHPDVMAQDTNQGYLLLIEGNYLIRNSSILKFYFLKFKNLHMYSQKENLLKKSCLWIVGILTVSSPSVVQIK